MFLKEQSFTSEDEAISVIPKLFKKLKKGYFITTFNIAKEGLLLGQLFELSSFTELNSTTCHFRGDQIYFAFVSDKDNQIITFRGLEKVVSYRNLDNRVHLHFFKDRMNNKSTFSEPNEIKENVKNITKYLKKAI